MASSMGEKKKTAVAYDCVLQYGLVSAAVYAAGKKENTC